MTRERKSINMRIAEELEKEIKSFAENNDIGITQASREIARVIKNFKGNKIRELKF